MVWEAIAAGLGIDIASRVITWTQGRRQAGRSSHDARNETRASAEDCNHVVIVPLQRGFRVTLTVAQIDMFRKQCWKCGLIATPEAFLYYLQVRGTQSAQRLGGRFEIVE